MNFGSLIGLATQNRIESSHTKVKGFSTSVKPAVKPVRSNVPSPNVQAFLAKQEQDKRQKEREFNKQKEHLLSLRAQNSKNNKKAKIMASRTKDNDFSRIRLTEDELEAKGKREAELQRKMLTDKVERMKARIQLEQQEALLPHKRKRKRKSESHHNSLQEDEDGYCDRETSYRDSRVGSVRNQDQWNAVPFKEKELPVKKKKMPGSSQPLNFQELLKVAAEKQHVEESSSEEDEEEDDDERNRRPMTKKDLERYKEQEMRRKGISVNNRIPAGKSKRPAPSASQVPARMNGNVKAQKSSLPNHQQQRMIADDKMMRNSVQRRAVPKESSRVNNAEKYSAARSQQDASRSARDPGNSGNDRHREDILRANPRAEPHRKQALPPKHLQAPFKNTSDKSNVPLQGRSVPSLKKRCPPPTFREQNNYDGYEERVPKQSRSKNLPNLVSDVTHKYENGYSDHREQRHPPRPPKEFSERRTKDFVGKSQRPNGPLQSGKGQAMRERNCFPDRAENFPHKGVSKNCKPQSRSVLESRERLMGNQSRQKEFSEVGHKPRKSAVPQKNIHPPPPPKVKPFSGQSSALSAKMSSMKQQMKLPSSRAQRPDAIQTSAATKEKSYPVSKRPLHLPEGNRVQGRLPSVSDERPKPKLPPIGQIRHKILGPRNPYGRLPSKMPKSYYESEDDEDDEMNDFIDDGNNEECNEDYSKYIRDIFGYDRRRYVFENEDGDEVLETSFAEQMKEEARSARIGLLEDLEDIRQEEEERKRKVMMMKRQDK